MFGSLKPSQSGSALIQQKGIKNYSLKVSEPEKVKKKIKYYQKN